MSETITVRNESGVRLWACVNKWGNSGDTTWFKFDRYETWERTDSRGFLLGVSRFSNGSDPSMYYVKAGGTAIIKGVKPFKMSFPDGSGQYEGKLNT